MNQYELELEIKRLEGLIRRLQGSENPAIEPWTDYSGFSTIVGWSAFTTKNLSYARVGKIIFVSFFIQGTSNSTATTFTLPYTSASGLISQGAIRYSDNTVVGSTPGLYALLASSNLCTCYKDFTGAAWTASGTKYVVGEFFYPVP